MIVPTLRSHPLYSTFCGIRQRCADKNYKQYKDYGGRGISVHAEWLRDPRAFIQYVECNLGSKPDGGTLDRINNDKGYEPGNIRWATRITNARNKRSNRMLKINGVTRCLAEWSELSGLSVQTLFSRISRKWDADSLLLPLREKGAVVTVDGDTRSLTEWSKITGIHLNTLAYRYSIGKTGADMLAPTRKQQ